MNTPPAAWLSVSLSSFVCLAIAHAQQPATWRRVPSLTGRVEHAMAYDEARERTVMFGGYDGVDGRPYGETFEYDGVDWSLRKTHHAPEPRRGHGMAFDRGRGAVVLFGGIDGRHWYRDTWEYDGVDWRQRTTATAPSPRSGVVMAYDTVRQVVLAYGGAWGLDLFWQWDGTNWTPLPPPGGMLIHQRHCGAFDAARGRFVVFGGDVVTQSTPYFRPTGETWEWDGATWVQAQPTTYPAFPWFPGSMAYDAARQRCLLRSNGYQNWEWDGTDWSSTQMPGPTTVDRSVLVYDSARARTVVFGGRLNWQTQAETWEFDGNAWAQRDVASPPAAMFPVLVSDPQHGTLEQWSEGDAWSWNGARWTWIPASAPPGSRNYPAFARDEGRGEVLCCGGVLGTQWFTDTWIWNGTSWQQRFPAQSPPPGIGSLCYDPLRGRIVWFADLGSMWEWDGATWWNIPAPGAPRRRSDSAVAFDPALGGILLHGGKDFPTMVPLSDSWLWNGIGWALVSTTGPVLASPPSLATDPVHARIVTIGTSANGTEVWQWNGAQWTPLPSTLRAVPEAALVAWDPAQQRLVLVSEGASVAVWSYDLHTEATLHDLGQGCGGALGAPVLTSAAPQLGKERFGIDLLQAPPFAPCVVGVALGAQTQPLGAGCTLHLQPPIAPFVAAANAHGFATVPMSLPVAPALRGLHCMAQGLVLDPTAPLGFALTAGLQIGLGD